VAVESGGEYHAFEEALVWSGFVVIGWGHRVYLVEPRTRAEFAGWVV
jgi:hypothetical protein